MAVNDILFVNQTSFGPNGSLSFIVAAGATAINVGEPVMITLGATSVAVMTTNKPVVSTDYLVGVAVSTSTQTASAAGVVKVQPIFNGQIWSISPNVASTWNTQAKYNALVGHRVLIDLTSSSYTLLSTDGSTYGCVVMPKDVTSDTNEIYFSFRGGVSFLS